MVMSVEMNETREVAIKARVSEVGDDFIVIHPSNDLTQSIIIPMSDVLAFGEDSCRKIEKAA
jgi:hypothetical protein